MAESPFESSLGRTRVWGLRAWREIPGRVTLRGVAPTESAKHRQTKPFGERK